MFVLKRPGVNREIVFCTNVPLNMSAVAPEGVDHSKSNKGVAEEVAR